MTTSAGIAPVVSVSVPPAGRVTVDGKGLRWGGERFRVCGATYGTFAPSEHGMFPSPGQVRRDFAGMAEAGVNVVRTYTTCEPWLLDLAAEHGLWVLAGVWWDDPRVFARPSDETWRAVGAGARAAVRAAAAALREHPAVLGLVVGNELPAPLVRWYGRRRVERLLGNLHEVGKEAAPELLFGYASYPTTEYLDTSCFELDCFNVFLEREADLARYLTALQVARPLRPLILTELGLDAAGHGELAQAEAIDWQLRVAFERGAAGACVFAWTDDWWVAGRRIDGWRFGVTDADRRPKPALATVEERYRRGLLGVRERWPSASVIVCAYQAEATLAECLASLGRLEYPDYEVLVVDDGSTDATAEVARRFPVRLLDAGRLGLSGARNLGLEHARGEVVAYVDADAAADPDWLTHLALALEPEDTAAAGGPSLPPRGDPALGRAIGLAPGGPTHVLLDHQRAEHIPGCNMAFRRDRLLEVGGFDTVFRTAGDDVDVCWRLQERRYTIRFAPAALVWHHARGSLRGFWRQQVGYGRAEALVTRTHPDKFDSLGRALWRGVIYGPAGLLPRRSLVYSGRFGEAPFQRLYQARAPFGPLPAVYGVAVLCALAAAEPLAAPVAGAALAALLALVVRRGLATARDENLPRRYGLLVGVLHVLQPLAREWGRLRGRRLAFPPPTALAAGFSPTSRVGRRLLAVPGVREGEAEACLNELRDRLRAARLPATIASPWQDADLVVHAPLLWQVRVRTLVQWDTLWVRLVPRIRRPRALAAFAVAMLLVAAWSLTLAAEGAAAVLLLLGAEGWWFTRRARRALARGAR